MKQPARESPLSSPPSRPARSARLARRAFSGLLLGSLLCVAGTAAAQADLSPAPPNVLLLIDTSGSMEYKTSSNAYPLCKYDKTGLIAGGPTQSETSRWIDLVQVLTGTISGYDCQTLDRASSQFKTEYALGDGKTPDPYDYQYHAAYHRPLSGTCAIGPGTQDITNPAKWPTTPFKYHTYNNTASAACTFAQNPDGMLDSYSTVLRFGLMTFDTLTSASTAQDGTFSYLINGTKHQGQPVGCVTLQDMEVGARNASAPPWEGRLVTFGDPSTGSTDYQTKNAQIQQVLLATRPFGATPIAGMLTDARDFLWNDRSLDPVDTTKDFGPWRDPYAACRDTYIVLMSDGQPNLDLRATTPGQADSCSGTGCPFSKPEEIAADLLSGGGGAHRAIKTYVVGFALNTLTVGGNAVDCSKLTTANLDTSDPTSLCRANPNDSALQACCALGRIALAGDDGRRVSQSGDTLVTTPKAYFANNPDDLRKNLGDIFNQNLPVTSRTSIAGGIGSSGATFSAATTTQFLISSGLTGNLTAPWSGILHRTRNTCVSNVPTAQAQDPAQGDFFEQNLYSGQGRARTFYTVQGTTVGQLIHSDYSIRPNITSDVDGTGVYSGTQISGVAAAFVSATAAASMGFTTTTTCTDSKTGAALTPDACRDRYLKWLVGLNNGDTQRCDTSKAGSVCSLLGDIYHSTPRMVNRPNEFVRDESYDAFRNTYFKRPMTVYTSTNDGFLHAFKVFPNDPDDTEKIDQRANNELWAFIPPQVLPHISSEYPSAHQFLLDGMPVVKDVVAKYDGTKPAYKFDLKRSAADAGNGVGDWRTILVQSFGGIYSGYFAVDITNPDPQQTISTSHGNETGGPQFLWQLTTDSAGNTLFGNGGATPLITTLFFDDGDGQVQEYPVAVLSGGRAHGDGTSTNRATPTATLNALSGAYPPRQTITHYPGNFGARSLTIVRLDTGKIVRTFRQALNEVPVSLQPRVIVSPLDSPISGQPIAYPADTGSIADRIFVGDQDGGLWRVDVSETDPSKWSMNLFWDTFPAKSIQGKPAAAWNSGQPIIGPPILSVDNVGNISIAVSTGDQDAVGSGTMQNYVWSLVEHTSADKTTFTPEYRWLKQLNDGQRVTGPISLFNRDLFFSTWKPPATTDVCSNGTAELFMGLDYLTPDLTADGGGEKGGLVSEAQFQTPDFRSCSDGLPGCISGTRLLGAGQQPVVYGIPIVQALTCFDTSTVTDPYLGSGAHTGLSNINPGSFSAMMQTGRGKAQSGGVATPATNGPENTAKIALNTPFASTRIDSWAAILE